MQVYFYGECHQAGSHKFYLILRNAKTQTARTFYGRLPGYGTTGTFIHGAIIDLKQYPSSIETLKNHKQKKYVSCAISYLIQEKVSHLLSEHLEINSNTDEESFYGTLQSLIKAKEKK